MDVRKREVHVVIREYHPLGVRWMAPLRFTVEAFDPKRETEYRTGKVWMANRHSSKGYQTIEHWLDLLEQRYTILGITKEIIKL